MARKPRNTAVADTEREAMKIHKIPLAQPDRSGPKQPTLFEFAAEREAELRKQIPEFEAKRAQAAQKVRAEQTAVKEEEAASEQTEDAFLTALIYGLTLTSVHLTLDILTWHQYAQELSYTHLIKRNLQSTLPVAILLIFVCHSPFFGLTRFEWLRQALFFCAAAGCGIYAVYLSNEGPFLAVMKNVPPVVTMAVWAVLEMGPFSSAASMGIVLLTALWKQWKLF